jgi:hypothetical protein
VRARPALLGRSARRILGAFLRPAFGTLSSAQALQARAFRDLEDPLLSDVVTLIHQRRHHLHLEAQEAQ